MNKINYQKLYDDFANLGWDYTCNRMSRSAMECYDKALHLNSRHIQSLLNKASLLILDGDFSKGKLYLNRILDIEPNNSKALYLLSTL